MSNLLLILLLALSACAMGLAKMKEKKVKVSLDSSTGVKGMMYHPNSKGVEMPVSHARALGFTEKDFMGEQPAEDEDTGESDSEGDSSDKDQTGTSESKEGSSTGEEETSGEKDSKEEASKPATSPEPISVDTPLYDKLIKDERFATVEALLENQEQLTDVDGIAKKTADRVIDHVKSK